MDINRKSTNNRSNVVQKNNKSDAIWDGFGRLLDRFWIDFGPKLGAEIGPSWYQNLKK